MPQDAPDFYELQPFGFRLPLADLAEHAARMKSPVNSDRTGQVAWFTDFRNGVGGLQITEVAGTGSALVADNVLHSAYGYKLNPFNASADGEVQVIRRLIPPETNKWGFEAAFSLESSFTSFEMRMSRFTGALEQRAWLRYLDANDYFEILDSAGNYQNISSTELAIAGNKFFHHIKLVADFEVGLYTRLLINNVNVGLSTNALRQVADASDSQGYISFIYKSRTNQNDKAYLGHIIWTVGES